MHGGGYDSLMPGSLSDSALILFATLSVFIVSGGMAAQSATELSAGSCRYPAADARWGQMVVECDGAEVEAALASGCLMPRDLESTMDLYAGNLKVLSWFLEHGVDPNNEHGMGGGPPLWMAAEVRCLACVKRLVEAGADVHPVPVQGLGTPLYAARVEGGAAIRSYLQRFVPHHSELDREKVIVASLKEATYGRVRYDVRGEDGKRPPKRLLEAAGVSNTVGEDVDTRISIQLIEWVTESRVYVYMDSFTGPLSASSDVYTLERNGGGWRITATWNWGVS